MRERAVIARGLLKEYDEVLEYDANAVADLAQTLGVTIEPGRKTDSEVKILARVLQLIKEDKVIDKILIVSEGEPCPSCDKVLKAFAEFYRKIIEIEYFYTKTNEGWKLISGKKTYP